MKENLYNFNKQEIIKKIQELGLQKYRSDQIYEWLYKNIDSFDEMTNLSKEQRKLLENNFTLDKPEIIKKQISSKTNTNKYLMKLKDNNIIECVLMKYQYGYSICISTQVGCKMNCSFCASGKNGYIRNLEIFELIGQILSVQKEENIEIRNVVLMGIGEPLDNFNNVINFIKIINSEDSLNIGMRRITLSTCGIKDKIYELADMNIQINLALSLHAVTDEERRKIMPIAKKYSLSEIIEAMNYYKNITGRRITYEYALIKDVNDNKDDAYALAKLIGSKLVHVNLIPINYISGEKYLPTENNKVLIFKDILIKKNIEVTIRRKLGEDIEAACGQLRRNKIEDA